MTDTNDMRRDFEAWFSTTFISDCEWDEDRNCYVEYDCHMAWNGYQAATERATPKWISAAERLPLEDDGTVAVMMDDGIVTTAWATYWHGASNKFAHWTFPFDCDDTQVTHWSYLPPAIQQGGTS